MSTAIVAARAVSDLAGMLLLGVLTVRAFAGLPVDPRANPPRTHLLVARIAAVWATSAVAGLLASAAKRAGIAPWRVDLADLAAEVRVAPATAVTATIAVTLLIAALFAAARRGADPVAAMVIGPVAIGLVAIGLAAGPATGHLGLSAVGAAVITVHVLTASWWFGSLAAMPLLLRGRAEWSACLTSFSRWAPVAVLLLGASGVVAALIKAPALDSGYAALLVAKGCAFVLLLAVGWWQRRRTVTRAHRRASERTRHAIAGEAGGLAAVTTLAAALGFAA